MPDHRNSDSRPAVDLDALRADYTLVDQLDADDLQHDDHGGDHVDHLAAHDGDTGYQPEPGRGVWVCHPSISRPVPTRVAVAAALTPAEYGQLQAEVEADNQVAQLVKAVLRGPVTGREPSKQGRR